MYITRTRDMLTLAILDRLFKVRYTNNRTS